MLKIDDHTIELATEHPITEESEAMAIAKRSMAARIIEAEDRRRRLLTCAAGPPHSHH